jgi:hypothetical protein
LRQLTPCLSNASSVATLPPLERQLRSCPKGSRVRQLLTQLTMLTLTRWREGRRGEAPGCEDPKGRVLI